MRLLLCLILFYLLLLSCGRDKQLTIKNRVTNDSINYWITNSKSKQLKNLKRKLYLNKALNEINGLDSDSLKLKYFSSIAYEFYKLKDTVQFIKLTDETIKLAKRAKDSFALGDANWNYASYFVKNDIYDNAYYHFNTAQKYFKNQPYYAGRMLIGKAYIKSEYADYIGSETLSIEAARIFKQLKEDRLLSNCYNHLGILQGQLNNYEKALFYYNKALFYENKTKSQKGKFINIYNNIAIIYQKMKDYDNAILYYKKGFSDSLKCKYPDQYANLLDNLAYTKLLKKDTVAILKNFKKALSIRDSINDEGGLIMSKQHLGEYHLFKKDTVKAYVFLKQANDLAKKIKNNTDYLSSLKLLAKVDVNNAKDYLKQYIQYKDSLQKVQLRFQNKFARISYETDEYIEETNYLKKRQRWLLVIGLGFISIFSLLYLLKSQRSKNQKLLFEAEQQKLNEELYLLALKRQERLEDIKIKERNRISEELHDGILSRLFGVRVSFDFMDLKLNDSKAEKYKTLVNELQDIEIEIRSLSHQLSDNVGSSLINFEILIEQLLKNKSVIGKFKYDFKHDDNLLWEEINPSIKVNLYRVLQEVFQNIVLHSKATSVVLNCQLKMSMLEVSIEDNGIGFDINSKGKGIGLKNIRSRVKNINGKVIFKSKINIGTTICMSMPLKK